MLLTLHDKNYNRVPINMDNPCLGDLLERAIRALPPTRWNESDLQAVCTSAQAAGLEAVSLLSLLSAANVGTILRTAPAVRTALGLNRRQLDRSLRQAGYSVEDRRAILGLPPL